MKKMISAVMALLVIWEPQVGPTWVRLFLIVFRCGLGQLGQRHFDPVLFRHLGVRGQLVEIGLDVELLVRALAQELDHRCGQARGLHGIRGLGLRDAGAATVHSVPPLNSMPRLSPPRRMMEMIPATMMSVEMVNQVRLRPTKSKVVSPR